MCRSIYTCTFFDNRVGYITDIPKADKTEHILGVSNYLTNNGI